MRKSLSMTAVSRGRRKTIPNKLMCISTLLVRFKVREKPQDFKILRQISKTENILIGVSPWRKVFLFGVIVEKRFLGLGQTMLNTILYPCYLKILIFYHKAWLCLLRIYERYFRLLPKRYRQLPYLCLVKRHRCFLGKSLLNAQ